MQITLYSSFSKEANSTLQPSGGGTAVNCVLKENVSVVHPIFILDRQDFSINYVQWGVRYYFVDDIVSIRNTTIELHCTVDVLATFKTAIGNSTQYVTRSASAQDAHVIDGLYPCKAGATLAITTLEGINSLYYQKGGTYVVGVIGKDASTSSGITYYAFPSASPGGASLAGLISFLFAGSWLDAPLSEISEELQKELINPFQYIVSCMWFPFEYASGSAQVIKFGYWDSDVSGYVIDEANRTYPATAQFSLARHPQASTLGIYMNSAPFTEHLLNVFSFGDIPIDPAYFVDNPAGYVTINTDMFTGVGTLEIVNSSQYIITRSFGQVGVPIQVSQITQNLIQSSIGMVNMYSQISSGVESAVQGSVSGIAHATAGAFSSVMNSILCAMPQARTQGSNGTKVAFEQPARIASTFRSVVDTDPEHNGKPLMQRKVINTLSGFVKVENPDVDIVGTTMEKNLIASYMASGFYYE